ncbi:MAG: hypothetical protein PHN44_06785 [Candidatus Marinimicrobia bacterium]|nr:hypothetical protein [Candidatus Neomarinimicrobiota bacterium]
MRIEYLRLKGFTGIKRGLGLDEIKIDFNNIVGLVAFAGQNGLGKSTVLENLHPFNTLASRSGAIFNHTYRRDSEKELSFSYNGAQYRTLLKIDCQSGKSEGYIWQNGESIVNGKIRDYSKKITEIFGSENLFFNSVFCAQNSTKLSDMTTGQLKNLFAEFLRLDRLQEWEETAKQVINTLNGKASQINTNIEALKIRMDGVEEINREAHRLVNLRKEQENHKVENSARITKLQTERENIKTIIATNDVLDKQVADLTAALTDMENNRGREDKVTEVHLEELRSQYLSISAEIKELDILLANEMEITAAAEKVKEINEKIETLNGDIEKLSPVIEERKDNIYRLEKLISESSIKIRELNNNKEIVALHHSIAQTEFAIKKYDEQLSALAGRDTDCQSTTCQFILKAREAEGKREEAAKSLNADREKLVALSEETNREINSLNTAILNSGNALDVARAKLKENTDAQNINRKELTTARQELQRYQDLAAKLPEIAVAKSKKEDRLTALEENKKQGTALSDAWKARKQVLDDQIAKQQEKILTVQNQIKLGVNQELKAVEKEIEIVTNSIKENETYISDTSAKIAKLQGELSGMAEAEAQLKAAKENEDKVYQDIAEWTYIKNACGKNGLQAMEIDGAAPLITSFANDLLSKAFGALYSVKLLTQDEEGKECLDIISIGEDGEEILLDNLSGGQKVWLLMALRLAMTLLSKEKGGRNFETAFFDEMDGALDSDNAINFINLYKSFMEIGKFNTIPFISHKPECRSMADHVLMFEAGKTPYWQ